MARRKYVVGNWKMNGLTESIGEARAIFAAAAAHPSVDVAICPPFTLIGALAGAVPGAAVGGQDCHAAASGAFTGSVAAPMLADAGATLTIVGHSERREGFGESDADVKAKAEAALAAGLDVILCVGEPREVRESGGAIDHVLAQVRESLPGAFDAARLAIAYEPIWAIGTGLVPTVEDVAAMHGSIRAALGERIGAGAGRLRILYGGAGHGAQTAPLLGTG
ncbi:MAG TPA: triose-phosphate isomerase, partial [Sphingopyxis sp.]|nr:triose-phosphate isomerase [Sphingopyxis sp.]